MPIITKNMLRDDQAAHAPFGRYLGCEAADVIRVHGSSGTSGKPTLYAFSRGDWDYIADVMAQGLYTCGVRPGDVVQLATVFSLFMGGWGALLGVERLGATAFPLGAGETERQLELMYRIGSTVLITTPTYALHMLETARALGYDTVKSPLRLGIFIGEPGSSIPGTRQALEQGWGIKVRDMATTSEMTPWATNAECEAAARTSCDAGRGVDRDRRQGRFHARPAGRRERRDRLHASQAPFAADDPLLRRRRIAHGLRTLFVRTQLSAAARRRLRAARRHAADPRRERLSEPGPALAAGSPRHGRRVQDRARKEGRRWTMRRCWSSAIPRRRRPTSTISSRDLKERVRHKLKNDTAVNFEVDILPPNTLERALSKAKRVDDRRPKYRPDGS